jgi:hypothetical protein
MCASLFKDHHGAMFTLVGIFSEWLASAMGPGFVDVVHGVLIGTSRLERPRDGR